MEDFTTEIDNFLKNYDYPNIFIQLDQKYIFKFNTLNLLGTSSATQKFANLVANLSAYFLYFLCFNSEQKLIQLAKSIKQSYCELCQTLKTDRKISHIDILLMLVTLGSKQCVKKFVLKEFEHDRQVNIYSNVNAYQNENSSIESYLYIILIQQTIGTLISPHAIFFLKKKYIKQELFYPDDIHQNFRLQQSMKHLQEKLNSHERKTLLAQRKKNLKSQIKILLNMNLKTKQDFPKKSGMGSVYEAQNIVDNLFKQKENKQNANKIKSFSLQPIKARSFTGLSRAFESNYGLETKLRDRKYHRVTDKTQKYIQKVEIKHYKSQSKQNQSSKTKTNSQKHDLNRSHSMDKWKDLVRRLKRTNEEMKTEIYEEIGKNKNLGTEQSNRVCLTEYGSVQKLDEKIKKFKQEEECRRRGESKRWGLPLIEKSLGVRKFIKASLLSDGKVKKKAKVNQQGRYFGIKE